MGSEMKVIHYTGNSDWELRPITLVNQKFSIKPTGALYTSPVGSNHGWRQWCEAGSYGCGEYGIELDIDDSSLFVVNSIADMNNLPWVQYPNAPLIGHVNYLSLMDKGFTGVWLTEMGEIETRWADTRMNLYGWDCETVAIFDEEIITDWYHI